MKANLIKDFYIIVKQAKLYLLFIVIYCLFPMIGEGHIFSALSVMFCALLPMTVMAYEERAKWDRYNAVLPVSREETVAEKYILSFILIIFGAVLVVSGGIIRKFIFGLTVSSVLFKAVALSLAGGLCFLSVWFPICFKAGVEKARIYYIVFFAFAGGAVGAFSKTSSMRADLVIKSTGQLAAVLLCSLAVYCLSLAVSVKFYRKKDL